MLLTIAALVVMQGPNTLSATEAQEGWKLLFDGKTMNGWTNFNSDTIRPGWAVKDGTLMIVDPNNAGDLVTKDKFGWFDLTLEYRAEKGQNSGIMFHVADKGEATWHSGPEVQIYDAQGTEGAEQSGFLYQLYKPEVPIAEKPAGQWNKLRLLISEEKCLTEMNGVKYYEYKLWSDDWNQRVAKSKFSFYPDFGKLKTGRIAIQGDHGVVAFRNIKIKPL